MSVAILEMAEDNSSQENNPWSNLSTVTTFNKGANSCPTRCVGGSKMNKNNKIVKRVTSSSIIIGSLINQLCTILEEDPVKSKKLYSMLCDTMYKMKLIDPSYKKGGFQFVQGTYDDAIYDLITIARATIGSDNSIPIPRPLGTYVSIYQDRFQETGFIAGGGFGNVYKAVHKLDEVEYAIKKIIVRPGKIKTIMTHLEEVKTLAKLNHTNIVAYKQAWIEPISTSHMPQLPSTSKIESNSTPLESRISCSIKNSQKKKTSYSYASYNSKKSYKFSSECQNLSYSDRIEKQSLRTHESNSDIVSFREDNEICDISIESDGSINIIETSSGTSAEESISSDESLEDHKICQYSAKTNQFAILYIQMELCEKTLRQWMDERIDPTSMSTIAAIATQILSGLNYIHSLQIVHHDIKPSNIFITTSGKLQVQLGDFGLACPLQRDSHDAIGGTCMYAAPEQLEGECNPKSDVYSLGIVLLELLIPMQTSMECIKMVESLKAGEIPAILASSYPQWSSTISQLIQKHPARRPSTDKMLEDLKIDKDLTIAKLQNEKESLQNEKKILQNENEKKDKIIEEQQIEIQQLLVKLAKLEDKR